MRPLGGRRGPRRRHAGRRLPAADPSRRTRATRASTTYGSPRPSTRHRERRRPGLRAPRRPRFRRARTAPRRVSPGRSHGGSRPTGPTRSRMCSRARSATRTRRGSGETQGGAAGSGQPTALVTSSAMRVSSAAVREVSANDVGHIGAVVEVRLLAEAERRVAGLELRGGLEEDDDLAVLGVGGLPVPGLRLEPGAVVGDDRVDPLGRSRGRRRPSRRSWRAGRFSPLRPSTRGATSAARSFIASRSSSVNAPAFVLSAMVRSLLVVRSRSGAVRAPT